MAFYALRVFRLFGQRLAAGETLGFQSTFAFILIRRLRMSSLRAKLAQNGIIYKTDPLRKNWTKRVCLLKSLRDHVELRGPTFQ